MTKAFGWRPLELRFLKMRFAATSFLALTNVAVLPAYSAGASNEIPRTKSIAALEKAVPGLMREAHVKGMSVAFIDNGRVVWLKSFGMKNDVAPVTSETTFEAASLSKVAFSYAVMKLVDQRKIDLDAPIQQYLDEPYIVNDPRANKVTARMILSHRTGFPNWRPKEDLEIHFAPGDHFSYSGEGFVLLSRAVEKITGLGFNEFMQAYVFNPLGMSSSSYVWRSDYDARTALGYDRDGKVQDKWKPKMENPASSLQTTAADYARLVAALLNGEGLKSSTLAQMETPQIAVEADCEFNCFDAAPLSTDVFWGLGIGLEETSNGMAFWHWGDNGAFKAYMVGFPARRSGLVMFTNSQNGLTIANAVVKAAFAADQPSLKWLKISSIDGP